MRPGQPTLSDFEITVLNCIAAQHQSIHARLGGLRVLSREFTGVGSFTNFQCNSDPAMPREVLHLTPRITMPGVPNGLGAVLFCRGGAPECLEVFAYGDEQWDGACDGFMLTDAV
jgi:hypothetical protein